MLARLARISVVIVLIFVCVTQFSSADVYNASQPIVTTVQGPMVTGQNPAVQAQLDQSNRYLSAELQRQLKDMKDQMLTELKKNQDDNTGQLYVWMNDLANTLRERVIVGTLGACLLIQAVLGFVYLYINRRYSYEYFLEKELRSLQGGVQRANDVQQPVEEPRYAIADVEPDRGLSHMQQTEWHEQVPQHTMSMEFGQQAASQMTAMNQWQFQAPHESGWKRQEEPVSRVQWEAIHPPVPTEGYEGYAPQEPVQFEYDDGRGPGRGYQ
jgi:hypothetical protein